VFYQNLVFLLQPELLQEPAVFDSLQETMFVFCLNQSLFSEHLDAGCAL